MYHAGVKYGFLTTYNETIFLKQDAHPYKPKETALWHSNVISWDANSVRQNGPSPMAVSLRECFLFLSWNIQTGHYLYNNKTPRAKWTGIVGGIFRDEDQISLDDSSDCSSSSGQESSWTQPPRTSAPIHHAPSNQPSRTSAPTYLAPSTTETAQRSTRSQSRARHEQDLQVSHRQQPPAQERERHRTRHEQATTEQSVHDLTRRTDGLSLERESRRGASSIEAYRDHEGRCYIDLGDRRVQVNLKQDRRGWYYKLASGEHQYVVLHQPRRR
ncbi:uncharacterized protein LDX57_006844 [Aspergillus melleus]|uniref:uncharacterized protein n=1 Tax=Aspergillus melleus TaxID=138277 RepID=UPI001E8E894C|nr:uncharacterized protein LDX57_006844 [Aspergillus melleus]KAH8429175.1 hypothetical protein LDX57_006844 [Aspergillus melleus]